MVFQDAIDKMFDGSKVTRDDFQKEEYWWMDINGKLWIHTIEGKNINNTDINYIVRNIMATDWHEYGGN